MDEVSFNGNGAENIDYRDTLIVEQYRDELCQELKYFLENYEINPRAPMWTRHFYPRCINLVKKRSKPNYPERNVIILPQSLKQEVIEAAHGNVLAGHGGIT